jgi:hypothetical protein
MNPAFRGQCQDAPFFLLHPTKLFPSAPQPLTLAAIFMNDQIKYGRSALEVGHFIFICIGTVLGGIGIVLTSVGWWLFGFIVVLIGMAYFGVNEMLGEE